MNYTWMQKSCYSYLNLRVWRLFHFFKRNTKYKHFWTQVYFMKWNKQDLFVFPHIWGHSQTFYFYQFRRNKRLIKAKLWILSQKKALSWFELNLLFYNFRLRVIAQGMNFYLYQKDVVTIPPYITRGTEPKNKSAEQRRPRKNANQ